MDFFEFINEKKLIILIFSFILNFLLIIIGGFLLYENFNHECKTEMTNVITNIKEDIKNIEKCYVDIKGEVKKPGVYEINENNIINDVISLAGGFTKNAYTKNINLSKKVSDELVIYVYSEKEYKKLIEKEEIKPVIKECICPSYEISDCINNGSTEIKIEENNNIEDKENVIIDQNNNTDVNKNEQKLININNATKEELMTLNGIGESKANSIIEYRKQTYFQKIEDIKNVSGIGDSAFEKIKEYITVK